MNDYIKKVFNSAIFQEIMGRHEFQISETVSIRCPKDADDREERIKEMRSHCDNKNKGRSRLLTPLSEDEVHAEFEDPTDAIYFKMTFG